MFEQTFKTIDDVLWKEAGCTTELDYVEQTSWLLFLKYLDDLEERRAVEADLAGRAYTPIIDAPHRWGRWAAPKDASGKLDHNRALTGPDLVDYVNRELFPYLQGFKGRSEPRTIEYKIGEIFGELKNKFTSGYSLRDALDLVDQLRFGTQAEKHELSELYEAKVRKMGNAGRNGGEYYTPRPLIRAMIQVVKPQLGDRIYDGACGSGGFLCEAFEYLDPQARTTADKARLQTDALFGKEKKPLAFIIGTMNMILHGIDAPNIVHANTLGENVLDIQEKDRFDVVLANPPFGGKERPEIQQNFPIKTGETAYLFLQHFIRSLRAGGRGAVVIKNTFLSNTDNASVALRKELLETCNLHTVLDMPSGAFQGTTSNTVVLFFEKGEATRRVWYYRLNPGRTLGKTNPLNDVDLEDFTAKQAAFAEGPNSWSLGADSLDPATYLLTVLNPNCPEANALHSPVDVADEIVRLNTEGAEAVARMKELLIDETASKLLSDAGGDWREVALEDVCSIASKLVDPKLDEFIDLPHVGAGNMESRTGELSNVLTAREEKLISGKFIFDPTMVLYSKIRPYLMKVCRPEFSGLCSADVYPLTPKAGELDRDFLFHLLLSEEFTAYAVAGSARAGMPKVNREHMFAYRFRLPPIGKQREIARRIDELASACGELRDHLERELTQLETLKQSFTQRAFLGEPLAA